MTTSQLAHHSYPPGVCGCQSVALLKVMRRGQELRLREMRPDQLQSHRQAVDEAAGHRNPRQAGEIRADGVDVVQVHGDRIVDLRADGECRRRRRRPDQQVDLLERRAKIVRDQAAHLLRLQIIRIEIAGRQHIGAGHDAAFDLRAEALAARALVQVHEILRLLRSDSRSARRRNATDSRSTRPARPRNTWAPTTAGAAGSPPPSRRRAT